MSNRKLFTARVAVLTVKGPGGRPIATQRFAAKGDMHTRIADAIATFARRLGISTLAVDYDIEWRTT